MIEKITNPPKKVAAHIKHRRARYAATAGLIAGFVVTRKLDMAGVNQAVAFLKEKELYDEFIALTDEI